jgi:hypothetical protein
MKKITSISLCILAAVLIFNVVVIPVQAKTVSTTTKKTVVKKTVAKKAVKKKIVVKKAPALKLTLKWDKSALKIINDPAGFDRVFAIRAAYAKKVENYAKRKHVKVVTAALINGMRE